MYCRCMHGLKVQPCMHSDRFVLAASYISMHACTCMAQSVSIYAGKPCTDKNAGLYVCMHVNEAVNAYVSRGQTFLACTKVSGYITRDRMQSAQPRSEIMHAAIFDKRTDYLLSLKLHACSGCMQLSVFLITAIKARIYSSYQ